MATGLGSKMGSFVRRRPLLVTTVVGVTAASIYYKHKPTIPEGDIWLDIDLSQPLATSRSPFNPQRMLSRTAAPLHIRDVVDALEMAAEDSNVVGLVSRFGYRSWNSMSLACTQELRAAVSKFRESSADETTDSSGRRRFTLAIADTFGEGLPAVGEYYLASAFEKIFIQPSGYVGLTGMGQDRVFLKRFIDRHGIKAEIFSREEYKSLAQSLTDTKFSRANRDATLELYQGLFDDVVDSITRSRGFKSKEEVYEMVDACPMGAEEALARKLVDGIMYPFELDDMVSGLLKGSGTTAKTDKNIAVPGKPAPTRVSMGRYIQHVRAKKAVAQRTVGKKVAVVEIVGGISRNATPQFNGPDASSGTVCQTLVKARKDPSIGAVVLRVESPGGGVVASDSISAAVKSLRAAGKPVICSMGNVAASGGYMIAAACDEIVAMPTTITGSIGVVAGKATFQRLLAKYGADVESIHLGANNGSLSPLSDFSPAQLKRMNGEIDMIYQRFLAHVAEGRNMTVEEVRKVAKGRVWTGRQAHERGLVDHLGGLNSAISRSRAVADLPEDTEAITYPSQKTLKQVLWMECNRFLDPEEDKQDDHGDASSQNSLLAALAEACLGSEVISALLSAVTFLTSLGDVMEGKVPRGVQESINGGFDVRMEDDEFWR